MLKCTKSHVLMKCVSDGELENGECQRNFTRYENCPGRPGVSVYTVYVTAEPDIPRNS